MKPQVRLSGILLLIAASACAQFGLPSTTLFAGVEGKTYSEGTRLLQGRLQARFPIGSSERKLKAYLEQQGLRIETTAGQPEPISGVARIRYDAPICGSQVRVSWVADKANNIQSIDVLYGDTGCP